MSDSPSSLLSSKQTSAALLLTQRQQHQKEEQSHQQKSVSDNNNNNLVVNNVCTLYSSPNDDTESLLPEVELCSLLLSSSTTAPLSSNINQRAYRLRFDPASSEYTNKDFKYLHYPAIDEQNNESNASAAAACRQLTCEQAEAALKYFVTCGERLSQMTRTYDDVNCLTDLLQEKERDLELAAIIGKSLLESNRALTTRNDELQERLKSAEDVCGQLSHDLRLTKQLLQLYTNDDDETVAAFDNKALNGSETGNARSLNLKLKSQVIEQLESKLRELKNENEVLRSRAARLETDTCGFETQEISLVKQCVHDLSAANDRVIQLNAEVDERQSDITRARDEKHSLETVVVELERKLKGCATQLDELNQNLGLSFEAEKYLLDEYEALQTKYEHVCECLQTLQDENRLYRQRSGSICSINSATACTSAFEQPQKCCENCGAEFDKSSPRRKKFSNKKYDAGANSDDDDDDVDDFANEGDERPSPKRRSSRISPGGDDIGNRATPATTAALTLSAQLAASRAEGKVCTTSDALRKLIETARCARINSPSSAWRRSSAGEQILPAAASNGNRRRQHNLNFATVGTSTDSGTSCSELESPSMCSVISSSTRQRILLTPSSSSSCSYKVTSSGVSDSRPRHLTFLTESSAEEDEEADGASKKSMPSYNYTGLLEIVKPLEGSLTLQQWSKLCVPRMADFMEDRVGVHTKGEAACSNSTGGSTAMTPSASAAELLLSNNSRKSCMPRSSLTTVACANRVDDALIEQLLVNIASRNRLQRTQRLQQQQNVTTDDAACAADTDQSSGIGSPLTALANDVGPRRVLTRASLTMLRKSVENRSSTPITPTAATRTSSETDVTTPTTADYIKVTKSSASPLLMSGVKSPVMLGSQSAVKIMQSKKLGIAARADSNASCGGNDAACVDKEENSETDSID